MRKFKNVKTLLGKTQLGNLLLVTSNMLRDRMKGGVTMKLEKDTVQCTQAEYICVFCGSIATFNIKGKGVCEQCRKDDAKDEDNTRD